MSRPIFPYERDWNCHHDRVNPSDSPASYVCLHQERARGYIELRFRHRLGAQAAPAPLVLTTGNLLELTGWYFALQHVTQSNLNMTSGSQNEVCIIFLLPALSPSLIRSFTHHAL
jgi:hypothetical protein